MIRNVGKTDRLLRFFLAAFLAWLGFWSLGGLRGNVIGLLVGFASLMPLTMCATGYCFVFRWFRIHSLAKHELTVHGDPYAPGAGDPPGRPNDDPAAPA
jgi:hypothetical protein